VFGVLFGVFMYFWQWRSMGMSIRVTIVAAAVTGALVPLPTPTRRPRNGPKGGELSLARRFIARRSHRRPTWN
jgi:hypothetical protein